jgi:hypothetical protein
MAPRRLDEPELSGRSPWSQTADTRSLSPTGIDPTITPTQLDDAKQLCDVIDRRPPFWRELMIDDWLPSDD